MPGALTFAVVETPLSNAKEKDTASVDTALSVDGYLSNLEIRPTGLLRPSREALRPYRKRVARAEGGFL